MRFNQHKAPPEYQNHIPKVCLSGALKYLHRNVPAFHRTILRQYKRHSEHSSYPAGCNWVFRYDERRGRIEE